ncbi:MAG: hypothetical protein KDA96_21835, partial [Planctomycetaceae bacterium]|nr:hypothetical protein [Planctomycetaceae bacterium]
MVLQRLVVSLRSVLTSRTNYRRSRRRFSSGVAASLTAEVLESRALLSAVVQQLGDFNQNAGEIDVAPHNFVASGDQVFFVARTPSSADELWVADGTSYGTHLVTDLNDLSTASVGDEIAAVPGGVV